MSKPILSLSQDAAVRAGKMTREQALSLAVGSSAVGKLKTFASAARGDIEEALADLSEARDAGDAREAGEILAAALTDATKKLAPLLQQLARENR